MSDNCQTFVQVAADEAAMEDGEQAVFKRPAKRLKLDTAGVGKVIPCQLRRPQSYPPTHPTESLGKEM